MPHPAFCFLHRIQDLNSGPCACTKYCTYWAISSILPESCLSPGSFEVKETPFLGSISLPLFGTVHGFLLTESLPGSQQTTARARAGSKFSRPGLISKANLRRANRLWKQAPAVSAFVSVSVLRLLLLCVRRSRGPGDKHHSDTGGVSSSFLNLRPAPSHQHHNFLWHLRQTYVIFSSTTL